MRVELLRRLGQNKAGTVVEVTPSEGYWLINRGIGVRVADLPAPAPEPEEPEVDDAVEPPDELMALTKAELVDMAEKAGVSGVGTKAEIAVRISLVGRAD